MFNMSLVEMAEKRLRDLERGKVKPLSSKTFWKAWRRISDRKRTNVYGEAEKRWKDG